MRNGLRFLIGQRSANNFSWVFFNSGIVNIQTMIVIHKNSYLVPIDGTKNLSMFPSIYTIAVSFWHTSQLLCIVPADCELGCWQLAGGKVFHFKNIIDRYYALFYLSCRLHQVILCQGAMSNLGVLIGCKMFCSYPMGLQDQLHNAGWYSRKQVHLLNNVKTGLCGEIT